MSAVGRGELLARPGSDTACALRLDTRKGSLYHLFIFNIALQLFDGMATYCGVHMGVPEGNQLLCNAFAVWGVGPSLLVFKSFACGVLLLLYRHTREELGRPAFTLLAGIYCLFSLIPWLAGLIALALPIF